MASPSSTPDTGAGTPPARQPLYKSLFAQILVAIVLGVAVGALLPDVGAQLKPLGDGFIRLIKMIIAPLIFLVIVTGIAHVGDVKAVGRVGVKALVYFLVASTFALIFGMVVANVVKPGAGLNIDPATLDAGSVEQQTQGGELPAASDFLLEVIPTSIFGALADNVLLQVLFFSVFVGAAVVVVGRDKVRPFMDLLDAGMTIVFTIMRWIMRVAPVGAFGAMAFIIGQYGLATLSTYAVLIAACYGAAAIFIVLLFLTSWALARVPLWEFVKFSRQEFALALGTASTESVLPRIVTKLTAAGVPRSVSGLVVPTGYSFNLDGAAIYLAISLLFLAQAFGIDLTLGEQLGALGILLLTSKGMAGVPGSSFLALSATATALGIFPVAGVALLLGADRIMDSMRVSVNLLGNCVAAFVVARWEGTMDDEQMRRAFAADDAETLVLAPAAA
jgi:aerobic C4-dicarboxylate transport protein